jgi:phosphate starvation-inducible PhoH-like protein
MSKHQRRLSQKEKRKKESDTNYIVNNRFNMRKIDPLTATQEEFFDDYNRGFNIAAVGTAGTGKTMCAMYLGLKDVISNLDYEKVIIVRSAVQTREQGFVPGTKQQKEAVFTVPYADIAKDLFQRGDAWDILRQKNMVEFTTSSFIRGLTFDNSIIIVDECQSMTYHELDSIITRVGECSKIIFCGDTRQDDLANTRHKLDVSGLPEFLNVLDKVPSFRVVQFGINDIVRSGLVKEYILAKEGFSPERILRAV